MCRYEPIRANENYCLQLSILALAGIFEYTQSNYKTPDHFFSKYEYIVLVHSWCIKTHDS